jgi:ABC-2 type transport system ATP-binding protein
VTGSSDSELLRVRGAVKRYGRVLALDGVDLDVRRGDALGLLGPNGAGKSTLVKSTCGLVRLGAGEIRVGAHAAGTRRARQQIGYLAELFRFPPWLTVEEALRFQQRLARSSGGATERTELLERVELAHARDRRVAALSKGMQQRLGIAQAIVGSPELVVLDEPTSALDPAGRAMVRELVRELAGAGTAVLISSHLLAEIEQCCDRVVILAGGRVHLDERIDDVVSTRGVVVETGRGEVVEAGAARGDAPRIVRGLVEAGEDVYAVRTSTESLESTYLRIVAEVASTAGVEAAG